MKATIPAAMTAAVMLGLASAAPVSAQPALKLPVQLSGEVARLMWCSALFAEEYFYWEDDREVGRWYDDLAVELEADAEALLEGQGRSREQIYDLWDAFDDAARDMAAQDEARYMDELEACEGGYGGLIPHPMS